MSVVSRAAIAGVLLVFGVLSSAAQEAVISFGGLKADSTLPIEVKATSLSVDQASGAASFLGDVVVTQGEMRLSADAIRVAYIKGSQKIDKLFATGDVVLVNARDAAQADEAVYTIDTGQVVMTGNVLLTQGQAAIRAGKLVIDLRSGTGRMEGGVTTTFTPGGN